MATKERSASRRPNTKQRAAIQRVNSGHCITCENKPQSRGLCFRCTAAASAAITRGETSDDELIENGLRLPRKRLGRPPESGFAKAMKANTKRQRKVGVR